MGVTRSSRSIVFTAEADAVTDFLRVRSLTFQGTGLTAGQRLRITNTEGSVLADYQTEAAIDNAEFCLQPLRCKGMKILNGPAAGTWVVTASLM